MDNLSVIIVAGGQGRRMGGSIPKQFLLLGDRPILMHTLQRFYNAFNYLNLRIVLVLASEYVDYWEKLVKEFSFFVPYELAIGGKERFHSVRSGLKKTFDTGLVAVHDGVRPLVTKNFLHRLYNEARKYGSAVPYVSPHSSVRIEQNGRNWAVDRSTVRLIQTPQFFPVKELRKAYEQDYTSAFTDDASVYERAGNQIHLVEGLEENIKLTRPMDLYVAREIIKNLGE
jgi:2-C-methyl-D-erythritol 4-phosphate cytidylyltransferase